MAHQRYGGQVRNRRDAQDADRGLAPDPDLNRYLYGLARVLRDGVPIGYLSTTVAVTRELRLLGWSRPQEMLVWWLEAPRAPYLLGEGSEDCEDGWDLDGSLLRELARDEFRWNDHETFTLRWVDPTNEPEEWRRHYEHEWASNHRATGHR
jgi:hypothetical protein